MYKPEGYYAMTRWHPEDVQALKPEWSTEQAVDFLQRNESKIQDRLVELGWEVLETLISME